MLADSDNHGLTGRGDSRIIVGQCPILVYLDDTMYICPHATPRRSRCS